MSELSVGTLSGLAANGYVVDVASGSTLDVTNATGTLPAAQLPAGSILQVVSATTTTETTISTDTLTDTTLKATITPSSTASKILVMCSLQTRSQRSANSVTSDIAIDRDGTVVFQNSSRALGGSAGNTTSFAVDAYQSLTYLDSPSTTSATEYTILAAPGTTTSSGQLVVQSFSQPSSIVIMEVAG